MTAAATALYLLNSAGLLVFAARYIFAEGFMPYHAEALGKPWNELDPRLKQVIRAMLAVIGGGMLAAGVTGALLSLFLLTPQGAWFVSVVPLPYLLFEGPALYATARLRRLTGARTPALPAIAGIVLTLIAYGLSVRFQP